MVKKTIGSILKNTFYAAHAKGIKFNWRTEDESKTPLTKQQNEDLTNLINEFLKNLSSIHDITYIQFEISNGSAVALNKYGDPNNITLNLPGMRLCYNGQDSTTFLDYLDNLKTAFAVAIKLVEWSNKFDIKSFNVSLEYDCPSGFENYMNKLIEFEKNILPKFIDKYNQYELSIYLTSNARCSFNYNYDTYNNKGQLNITFTLGDVDTPDFIDLIDKTMAENAAYLMEVIDFFLKYNKMGSDMTLDFYNAHFKKYYPKMKQHYMNAIKSLIDKLLKKSTTDKVLVSFTIGTKTSFYYSNYSGTKTYQFMLPYTSSQLILHTESKAIGKAYTKINKAFLNIINWSEKTGIGRLSFDKRMTNKICDEAYMNTLLEVLKSFIEKKIEISQRTNMCINFVNPSEFNPSGNSLSYFSIPYPDCYDDELKTYLTKYLSKIKIS